MTEEAQQKKVESAMRRKKQLHRQLEEEKAAIVKKLLSRGPRKNPEKTDEKTGVLKVNANKQTVQSPAIRFVATKTATYYELPKDFVLPPLVHPSNVPRKGGESCIVCGKPRRYLSKQQKPLCSLECYQALA